MTFDKEKEFERRIAQHMRACVHFTGIQNLKCRAEIFYDSIKDDKGTFAHIPCLKDDKSTVICNSAKFPSREDAIKDIEKSEIAFQNCMKARKAIVEYTKGARGLADKITCPICEDGTLYFSIASCNGHIHAQCDSKNCVSWME